MGHDHHFLSRLDRFATPEVELALSLYRDHLLVRLLLKQAKLPDGADRVAISLDDPVQGPFIIVARDGGFVTCLGRGMMKPGRHPIITRKELDRITAQFNDVRERFDLAISLTGGQVMKLYNRLFRAGPWLTREEARALVALQPLVWTELYKSYFELLHEIEETRPIFRNVRKLKPLRRELLRLTWDFIWAIAHLIVLLGLNGRAFFDAVGEQGVPFLRVLLPSAVSQTSFLIWARTAWAAAHIGAPLFPSAKECFADGKTYVEIFGGRLALPASATAMRS